MFRDLDVMRQTGVGSRNVKDIYYFVYYGLPRGDSLSFLRIIYRSRATTYYFQESTNS